MNENYLWDKSGEDAEIERLENALQAFRFKETGAPAISLEVSASAKESKKSSRKRFSRRAVFPFALAAACVMFGLLAFGVWLQTTKRGIQTEETVTQTVERQTDAIAERAVLDENSSAKSDDAVIRILEKPKKIKNVKRAPVAEILKISKIVTLGIKPQMAETRKPKARTAESAENAIVNLSDEERYAYGQLMLALSITSSKFKMVKDKVENVQEKFPGSESAR